MQLDIVKSSMLSRLRKLHNHTLVKKLLELDSGISCLGGEGGTSGTLTPNSMSMVLAAAVLCTEALGFSLKNVVFLDVGAGYGLALMGALVSGFSVAAGIEAGMSGCSSGRGGHRGCKVQRAEMPRPNDNMSVGGGPAMLFSATLAGLMGMGVIPAEAKCEILFEMMMGASNSSSVHAINYAEYSGGIFGKGFKHVPVHAGKVCFAFDAVFVSDARKALFDFVCGDKSVIVFFTSIFHEWNRESVSNELSGSFTWVATLPTAMKSGQKISMMVFIRV